MSKRLTERQRQIVQRFMRLQRQRPGTSGMLLLDAKTGQVLAPQDPGATKEVVVTSAGKGMGKTGLLSRRLAAGRIISSEEINRVKRALDAGSAATGAFRSPSLPQPRAASRAERQAD